MRRTVGDLVISAGALLVAITAAADSPTRIEKAPCDWFVKFYPDVWGRDHNVMINPNLTIEHLSFSRGTFQLIDGADAYDYLDKRCGGD